VAALAVASALFDSKRQKRKARDDVGSIEDEPFHYCLACRWVGQDMAPFPAQGKMSQGHADATLGLQAALKKIRQHEKRRRRRRTMYAKKYPETALRISQHLKATPRKIKPYGIFAAVPVYVVLTMMIRSMFYYLSPYIPGSGYIKTIANQGTDLLGIALGFVLAELRALPARLPVSIPGWLLFRGRSGNYIQF